MTKKNPSKAELRKLKKIEDDKQRKRTSIARCVIKGWSFRKIGGQYKVSHQTVKYWADLLLDKWYVHKFVGKRRTIVAMYQFKENWQDLVATRTPGPRPGVCPKAQKAEEGIIKAKSGRYGQKTGARKIAIQSKTGVSGPTAAKVLKKHGCEPVTKYHPRHSKRWCAGTSNGQWDIDFVELGKDPRGRPVESLSVEDDNSRLSLVSDVTIEATTDHVIRVMEMLIEKYGKPKVIHSDHGSQFFPVRGGDGKFDAWCEEKGIIHTLAPVRTPQENGKVERYHGTLRREAELPKTGTVQEYSALLEEFRRYYNHDRPHCSLDYRTPHDAYLKAPRTKETADDLLLEVAGDILDIYC